MKKMFLSAILFMGLGTMAFAQQSSKRMPQSLEQRAEKMTAVLTKELQLNEDQQAKIYAINLDHAKQRDAERKERMHTNRTVMKESLQKQNEQITSVLNGEQKAAYENLKKERQANKKHFRKPNLKKEGRNNNQDS